MLYIQYNYLLYINILYYNFIVIYITIISYYITNKTYKIKTII